MFEEQVDMLLKSMTLPEKIGQMMMVGFKGPVIDEELQLLLNKYHVGGVILFSRNVKDPYHVVSLTSHLQKKKQSLIPLFIAVDQEGGSVSRLQKGVVVLPSPMALGATRNSKLAFLAGKMTGLDLSSLGINMNLAPVLGVNRTSANNAIGVRSFGEDPELVAQLGVWYVEGLQTSGVVATAKHFPGHGNTHQDSHYKLPIVEEKWNILPDIDSKPL